MKPEQEEESEHVKTVEEEYLISELENSLNKSPYKHLQNMYENDLL